MCICGLWTGAYSGDVDKGGVAMSPTQNLRKKKKVKKSELVGERCENWIKKGTIGEKI